MGISRIIVELSNKFVTESGILKGSDERVEREIRQFIT